MGRKKIVDKIREILSKNHQVVDHYYVGDIHTQEYDIGPAWVHKETGEYFTSDSDMMIKQSRFLLDYEIDTDITHGLGFSQPRQKWYGWSHRAIYGFGIGSTVKKGDSGFRGLSLDDIIEDTNNFWESDYHISTRTTIKFNDDENKKMMYTEWTYNDKAPSKSIHGKTSGAWTHIPELGKGEWTATTLEEAKEMANDFGRSVS